MQITGKVYEITPVEQGVSQSGQLWAKRTLVIQTMEDYPKTIAMTVFGKEKCLQVEKLFTGQTIQASISVNSRKYENKWYSEVSCIGLGVFQQIANQQEQQPQQAEQEIKPELPTF